MGRSVSLICFYSPDIARCGYRSELAVQASECFGSSYIGDASYLLFSAAILEGDFALMGEGKLKLTFLPENSQLMSGDLVTTSGRGGVFPSGIVAGHVEEVRTDASGIGQYAVIVPETDLNSLKQVFIIKNFTIVE